MKIDKHKIELEEIRKKNGIEYTTLSDWTGIDYDILWRQFNTAKHFRDDVRCAVEEAFKAHGLITSDEDQINELKDELLNSEAIINGALSIINRSFMKKISDKKWKPVEKKEFIVEIRTMQNKVNDAFDSLRITVEMK